MCFSLNGGTIMHEQAGQIIERLIAIDTEYHADKQGRIDKVFCLCAQNASGNVFKQWTINYTGNILEDLKAFYGVKNPIFVCHAFDKIISSHAFNKAFHSCISIII